MMSLNFFNFPNLTNSTMALGFTQPLKKLLPEDLSGGKSWPARKADNLTAIDEPIAQTM
jgi:hypothetical protein